MDEIWYVGDIGLMEVIDWLKVFKFLWIVWGNIDLIEICMEIFEFECFELEGVKVLMMYIGGRFGKYVVFVYVKILEV